MTNNYVQDNTAAPGTAPAHSVYGEAVTATLRQPSSNDGTLQAVGNTFRPYQKPKRRSHDHGHVLCEYDGCKAYPSKGTGYCIGHARSLGLVENWGKDGRQHESD